MAMRPLDFHGNVARIGQDEFLDLEADIPDREGLEQIKGDFLGQGFEELAGAFGDNFFDLQGHIAVVDGPGQIIRAGGVGKGAADQFQGDEQALGLAPFRFRHADMGEDFKVNDADEIGHDRAARGSGR